MITDAQLFGQDNNHLLSLGEFQLHRDVAEPFMALQQACVNAGFGCDIVSSYRNFEKQLSIWERKWQGILPLRDAQSQLLDHATLSDDAKIDAILTWSALPGASRHHWGTDIDVYDKAAVLARNWQFELIPQEYEAQGPCSQLAEFLAENLADYGFSRPYAEYKGGIAQEPWHISHTSVAKEYESALTPARYFGFLSALSFSGKNAVLKRFDEIYERFVFNKGVIR